MFPLRWEPGLPFAEVGLAVAEDALADFEDAPAPAGPPDMMLESDDEPPGLAPASDSDSDAD